MITANNITFRYPGTRRNIFSDLSLELKENTIYGLLGKNGMGKSTLLYLLCGLLQPQKGTVTIDGIVAAGRKPEVLADIFIVAENFELPPMTLSQYVKVNAPFYPHFSEEVLKQCLSDFELSEDIQLNALSMGQKKKVYMSFALASGTKLLLMDEPTNGLDIPSKAQFRKVMARSMQDDRIVIISTHQVHDIDTLIDHVMILDNSEILLNASSLEICDKYVFEYRMPNDMDDVIYAEPSLQGNAVMAPRGDRAETSLNLELLFNAVTQRKI